MMTKINAPSTIPYTMAPEIGTGAGLVFGFAVDFLRTVVAVVLADAL